MIRRVTDFVTVFIDAFFDLKMPFWDALEFAAEFRPIRTELVFSEDGTEILNWDEIA